MQIKYKSVTGKVDTVEVDDDYGTIVIDSRRTEHAGNEKERSHRGGSVDDMR